MAGISFDALASLNDPAPAWRFLLDLGDLPAISAGDSATKAIAGRPRPAISSVRAESVNWPHYQIMNEEEFYAGSAVTFPTTSQTGEANVIFYESGEYDILAYMLHWMYLVKTPDGYYGLPIVYRRQLGLTPLRMDGSEGPRMRYTAWPTAVTPFQYNGGSSERISCEVTFSVFYPDYRWDNQTF